MKKAKLEAAKAAAAGEISCIDVLESIFFFCGFLDISTQTVLPARVYSLHFDIDIPAPRVCKYIQESLVLSMMLKQCLLLYLIVMLCWVVKGNSMLELLLLFAKEPH